MIIIIDYESNLSPQSQCLHRQIKDCGTTGNKFPSAVEGQSL